MTKNSGEILAEQKATFTDRGKSPYPPEQSGHDDKQVIRESEKNARAHQKAIDRGFKSFKKPK
jgi:hypothetical protein